MIFFLKEMSDQMNLTKYCKSGDTTSLDKMSKSSRRILIQRCGEVLLQGTGDKKIAMDILKHFGVVESFFNVDNKDVTRYTGNLQLKTPIDNLLFRGAAIIPIFPQEDIPELEKNFDEACLSFPEYLRDPSNLSLNPEKQSMLYVLGGFGALGNPASFHNPFVRSVRSVANTVIREELFTKIAKSYPDKDYGEKLRTQVLIDRMMLRPAMQEPVAEAWHRDIADKKVADIKKGDIIFGGWVNTSTQMQGFSFIPGSHLGVDQFSLKSGGFAEPGAMYDADIKKLKTKLKKASENDKVDIKKEIKDLQTKRKKLYNDFKKFKSSQKVPPGHAIIFPQYVLHEVVSKGVKHPVKRLFTGYRLTTSSDLLFVDSKTRKPVLKQNLKNQSIMRLGGGMRPPMYSANHIMNWRKKSFYIFGSKNPQHGKKAGIKSQIKETLTQWSLNNFKKICLETKKTEGWTFIPSCAKIHEIFKRVRSINVSRIHTDRSKYSLPTATTYPNIDTCQKFKICKQNSHNSLLECQFSKSEDFGRKHCYL